MDRNCQAAYKTRQCAAIVDLVLHRGEHMVGYKSISKNIEYPNRRLDAWKKDSLKTIFFHRLGGSSMSWTPAS